MELHEVHKALRLADTVVEKAVAAREVARIARIETLARKFINGEWDRLARQASEEAARMVRGGSGPMTRREHSRVMAAVNRRLRKFPSRVRGRFLDDIEDIYRLAKIAGHRKATGQSRASLQYNTKPFSAKVGDDGSTPLTSADSKLTPVQKQDPILFPSFNVIDTAAVSALQSDQAFWIGQHYDANVRNNIANVTRTEMLESGRSRALAGRRMESVVRTELALVGLPTGWRGTSAQYFEGLVANAATVARVQGQLRSFTEAQVTRYQIVNPADERTCPVCSHMDNKIFDVEQGVKQMQDDVGAETPQDVRNVHPWIRVEQLKEISPRAGEIAGKDDSAALSRAGFALPPFHFRCRCTVDVTATGA